MRNGLTKALAAVAIACLGYQAFAIAPVIRAIPSPVVTDDGSPVTGVNLYMYGDFQNLNNYVSDDGNLANIIWSYSDAAGDGSIGRYALNGARKLNITGGDSPTAPPATTIINSATNIANAGANYAMGAAAESNPDSAVAGTAGGTLTPTIRDVILSPFNGPNDATVVAPGTLRGSEVVTLFASDGTTESQGRPLIIWSVKEGGTPTTRDRLSATPEPAPTRRATQIFTSPAATNGWVTGTDIFGPASYNTTGGICISINALGAGSTSFSIADWISPYQIINLVDNKVWRIRVNMTTNQATSGLVPLWGMLIQNIDLPFTARGDNAYIGDYEFLDNIGSANAIKGPTAGLNQFDIWFTPAAVSAPQWRDGATGGIAASNDANNDMRLVFRVLAAGGAGYLGELDSVQICMTNCTIDEFDLSKLYSTVDVYNLNPIVSGINGVTVSDLIFNIDPNTPGAGTNVDFTTNPVTLSPKDPAGWLLELTVISPGDTNNPAIGGPTYGTGTAVVDNYPVTWLPNTLYETTVVASAPTVADAAQGPDALDIGYDTKTNELFGDSFMLTGLPGKPGMPKATTQVTPVGPQNFVQFFWSHNTTASAVPEANRLRYKIQILSTDNYNRPLGTDHRNTGALRIHQIKVSKVLFFGMN